MPEPSAPLFSLVLRMRTGSFGESAQSESAEVARLLRVAAHTIESGAPIVRSEQRQLKCRNGLVVGEFEFGPGAIRGPGVGFDQQYFRAPSALEIANRR
ncbi:hypothetical protein ACVWWO_009538 [Bradyrhizobium sp. F1.13.1]